MSRWHELRDGKTDALWQLYHENSKLSGFPLGLMDSPLAMWQDALLPSLSYASHPATALPPPRMLGQPLEQALRERKSVADLERRELALDAVATLLHFAYGITRPNPRAGFPHGFRAVPSGGALYPLELYFNAACVDGLEGGIYHYEPVANVVRRIVDGDQTAAIAEGFFFREIAEKASLIVFITGLFERTTMKYGERGYRFALLEAGHVAQNLALVTAALGLQGLSIGGFYDRRIDALLDIDGVDQSTLYAYAAGRAENG